jgi:hypothetical protein
LVTNCALALEVVNWSDTFSGDEIVQLREFMEQASAAQPPLSVWAPIQ